MHRLLFGTLMLFNLAALGLWLVLALAAAKPSHTPVLSVLGLALIPLLAMVALVWLHLRGPWAPSRGWATGLAALPLMLVAGSLLLSRGIAWSQGLPTAEPAHFDPVLQQRLEAAIAAGDAAAAGQMAADRSGRINDAAALLAAIRLLEQQPAERAPLRALLQAGVKPGATGGASSPLEAAIRVSRKAGAEPAQWLLQAGADPNQRFASQPAWFAALEPRIDSSVLSLLLAQGADLQGRDMAGRNALAVAVDHKNWGAAARLVEQGADGQALRNAQGEGLRQIVDAQRPRHPDDPALAQLAQRLDQSR